MNMRALSLVVVLLAAAGFLPAAQESFTLDDGRTITGEYDEADQRLYTTIDGKTKALLVSPDQIVERGPVGGPPPKAAEADAGAPSPAATPVKPAVTAEAPKPMTPEEKKAADAAFALALIQRASDKLLAEADKATRDAAGARKDAERKRAEAIRHRTAFLKRLEAEPCDQPWTMESLLTTLYVLPRTAGNNRATVDAGARAGQLEEKAARLDALAAQKRAEAASVGRGVAR